MAELRIYDRLSQFPLFLGMSHNDIMELVAHNRLDFIKMPPDYYDILKKGQNKGVAIKYFKKCYPGDRKSVV